MKLLFKTLLLLCFSAYYSAAAGQACPPSYNSLEKRKAARKELLKHDLSGIFTHTDNTLVFGFIGDDFQRLRIKFLSVKKDPAKPDGYIVTGKSLVKNNIQSFTGRITINVSSISSPDHFGVDDEYKDKGIKGRYALLGFYLLSETGNDSHSGVFKGFVTANVYIDKNNVVQYDDIDIHSDSYSNNQFTGQWISHDKKQSKTCNWGDYRIPNSGSFDEGAGEFSPIGGSGWENVRLQWSVDKKVVEKAKKAESAKWWL
nr:hypothetical protein [uncultured Mucilaginibacter sp.]